MFLQTICIGALEADLSGPRPALSPAHSPSSDLLPHYYPADEDFLMSRRQITDDWDTVSRTTLIILHSLMR